MDPGEIELPLKRHAPQLPATRTAGSSDATCAGLRILLVEDNEDTRGIFEIMLRLKGHLVESAATGEAALTLARRQSFDLVISDLGLPDFSGIELMTILHERYSLRGIAVTGYSTEEDIRRSKSAGFEEHLVKPVDPVKFDQLLTKVGREIRSAPPPKPKALTADDRR